MHANGEGYLLYHSIGQYPGKAADMSRALASFADAWGRADDGQWPVALRLRQRFIDRWRAIIGAPPGTLTTSESVTSALSSLIGALPDGAIRGRRVLVAGDCFPSVHFLLSGLQGPLGFRLETVPLRQGAAWVEDEDILAHWGEDVGLALLTWVSSTSSHRSDIAALCAHGRRKGSLVGVDITQGAGLLPFNVFDPEVDFTLSTSLKWMCGSPGAGILHVAAPLIERCAPTLRGWFSQPDPFNWDINRFDYAPDIRRFDHGTPGIMACAASLPALDWHADQDAGRILAHNRTLCAMLTEALPPLGLALISPPHATQRGGSVMVRLADGMAPQDVLSGLRAKAVHADTRGQTLRLSPGTMTHPDGIQTAIEALHQIARGRSLP